MSDLYTNFITKIRVAIFPGNTLNKSDFENVIKKSESLNKIKKKSTTFRGFLT